MTQRFLFYSIVIMCGLIANQTAADVVIFHNGDFKYGDANVLPNGDVILTVKGVSKVFKATQVKDVVKGINKPAPGEVVRATDFVHAATSQILDITGWITHRTTMTNYDQKKFTIDVEDGFEIPIISVYPTHYTFFKRQGTFMKAALINSSSDTFRAVHFRVSFYDLLDEEEKKIWGDTPEILLGSKDLYFRTFPGRTKEGPYRLKVEVDMPDVPYERIDRIRVIRRY